LDLGRRERAAGRGRSRGLAARTPAPGRDGRRGRARPSVGVRAHIDVATTVAVPSEVSRTVYLCCVGALERFAEGTSATVAVRAENRTLAFEIVADSPGLATTDADLAAVRDRVEALGGRLTIAAESGATRIAGSLPIR